jgi:5-methylcytosine-specific restriction endonuclease McrA
VCKADYQRHHESRRAKAREWQKANTAYFREWRANSPERQREYLARRNAKDPDRHKRYYAENRDAFSARVDAWRAANPDKVRLYVKRSEAKRRAQRMALPTEDIDFTFVFERDGGMCGICGQAVTPEAWDLDHIVPLSLGGHHVYSNVQVSHPRCNRSKGGRLQLPPTQ